MSAVESSPVTVAAGEQTTAGRDRSWLALLGLVVVAAVAHAVLALRAPVPILSPDEFRYGHLARSLADGEGFDWRGVHIDQVEALYIYLLAPIWKAFHDTVDAYHASKLLNTLLICAQAVPVFVLSRAIMRPAVALVPAALTLVGPWMFASHMLMTEALAMPLSTTAACLAGLAMYRRDRRLAVGALVFAVLSAWARAQMIVLVPALLVAFALNALREPTRSRHQLSQYRWQIAAGAALCAAGVIAVLVHPSLIGDYQIVKEFRPGLGRLAGRTGWEVVDLIAATGVLPGVLALGAATNRKVWRDPVAGPLLCLFVPITLVTVAVAGFYVAGVQSLHWGIERYVWYVGPIAVVLAVALAQDRRLLTWRTLAPAVAIAALCVLRPDDPMHLEERGTWAIALRVHALVPVSAGVALAVVGLAAVAAVVAATRTRPVGRAATLLVVTAATGLILLVQEQASWQHHLQVTRTFRASMPDDLQWIDHHASGPVAVLAVSQNAPAFPVLDFFNRSITQVYLPPSGLPSSPMGRSCGWDASADDGSLRFGGAGCPSDPRTFLVADPQVRLTFADEVASAADEHVGRLVRLAPGAAPKLQSLIFLPCARAFPHLEGDAGKVVPATAPHSCSTTMQVETWLGREAQLVLRYAGGTADHTVTRDDGHQWNLPAHRVTSITMPVAAGPHQIALQDDWTTTAGAPRLLSVDAVVDGKRTPLI
ncbi:MAG TPA: hypothetical protein VFT50_11490 [Baekduia sp.]|nr:hypothetical protein [Baekduia sp.]